MGSDEGWLEGEYKGDYGGLLEEVSESNEDPSGVPEHDGMEEEGVDETQGCPLGINSLTTRINEGEEKPQVEFEKGTFDTAVRNCGVLEELSNHRKESEEDISSFSGNSVRVIKASGQINPSHTTKELKRQGLKKTYQV